MTALSDFVPELLAMGVGALLASVGLGRVARRPRGRRLLARLGPWTMAGVSLLFLGAAAAGLVWFARGLLDAQGEPGLVTSPAGFGLLGLLIGLAFALPTVLLGWSEARASAAKKRTAPATRDERRAFARQLADQIRDASERGTGVVVRAGGDGDRILFIEGPLDSGQGNRLVTALQAELQDLGFKRVEGTGAGGDWWAPV